MSSARLQITRKQLSDFLKDPDSIKAFERLFSLMDGLREISPLGAGWETALIGAAFDGIIDSGGDANSYWDKYGNGIIKQRGWGFVQGDGTNTAESKTVTFPLAFVTITGFVISCIGTKTGADPASIIDFPNATGAWANAYALNLSQFIARLNASGALVATGRYGYSWEATGRWE